MGGQKMADEINPEKEIPLVLKVDDATPDLIPPLVTLVKRKPKPGFFEAIGWCLVFLASQALSSVFVIIFAMTVFAIQRPDPSQFVTDQLKGVAEATSTDMPADKRPPAMPDEFDQALAYAMLIAPIASLGVILLVLPWRIGKDWKKRIAIRTPALLHVFLILLLTPGFLLLTSGIEEFLQKVVGITVPSFAKSLNNTFNSFPWFLTFLAIGLGPGVVEEVWCRGFLGRGLTARYGVFFGVTLTSILFGLLHCSLTYAIPTAIMGAYLHFVYLTSRSIWISILLHTLNNSIGILLILTGLDEQLNAEHNGMTGVIYLVSFSLVLFASIAIWTSRARAVPVKRSAEDRLKSTDGSLDYPGLSALPHDSGKELKCGRASPTALIFTLASFALLIFLLFG
jgi:uncharacterized protein